MTGAEQTSTVLVFDADPVPHESLQRVVSEYSSAYFFKDLEGLLAKARTVEDPIFLLDLIAFRRESPILINRLLSKYQPGRIGLMTEVSVVNYCADLLKWGLHQVTLKKDPFSISQMKHFLRCLDNPLSGFGLAGYFPPGASVFTARVRTLSDKRSCIDTLVEYFRECGIGVRDLYDVRVAAEESLNNAMFHAHKTEGELDKYRVEDFGALEPEEEIIVEYGGSRDIAGFSVLDRAGSLQISTVLEKLRRQASHEGIYDMNGRGFYLSRILTSAFILSIEPGVRTQSICLFDGTVTQGGPKPLRINYAHPVHSALDSDFD